MCTLDAWEDEKHQQVYNYFAKEAEVTQHPFEDDRWEDEKHQQVYNYFAKEAEVTQHPFEDDRCADQSSVLFYWKECRLLVFCLHTCPSKDTLSSRIAQKIGLHTYRLQRDAV